MSNHGNGLSAERAQQIERIQRAAAEGVRAALRRHMLLGESVAVAGDNGEVKILGPEEIRRALDGDDQDAPPPGGVAPTPRSSPPGR